MMVAGQSLLLWLLPAAAILVAGEMAPPVTINTFGSCASADGALEKRLDLLEAMLTKQQEMISSMLKNSKKPELIRDCGDVYQRGNRTSGVYAVRPAGSPGPLRVYCDFQDDAQWTVIQRRTDGDLDFQRSWAEYKKGFGRPEGSLWLGNDALSAITVQRQYRLRVEITDWQEVTRYADYSFFLVEPEAQLYRLHYTNYTGTAGDSLGHYHYNQSFSTLDRDHDASPGEACARLHGGGWWYRDCDQANLNGRYRPQREHTMREPTDVGVEWDAWKEMYSFKRTSMKIAPAFRD